MNQPLLLTPEEAAEQLRISKAHLYDLKARQRIRFVKIGRCLRFRMVDLEAFIEKVAEETKQHESKMSWP